MILGLVSVFLSSLRSATVSRASIRSKVPIRKLELIFKALAYFFISMVAVQDLFFGPSRISMNVLLRDKWLPSRLSKYSIVHTAIPRQLVYKTKDLDRLEIEPMGVHFIDFENDSKSLKEEYKFDAIHFNHGFGASSLSWLPAIPSLVQKLHGKFGLAHDAPGFGFTDRPVSSGKRGGLVPYSSAANAAIGNVLLRNKLGEDEKMKRIALFGHSMGCSATLKMTLTLPLEVEKVVVLVAPALVGKFPDENGKRYSSEKGLSPSQEVQESVTQLVRSQPSRVRDLVARFLAVIRTVVLDFGVMYVLRRVVGRPGFWKNGLRLAWGDPNRLTETDVLRFQWPSIGKGWESGLLSFTRSRIASSCAYRGGEVQLLCDVLSLPNTRVILVQGTKDPIVPATMAKRIADHCQGRIHLIELEGQGHDPFEESVDVFVQRVLSEIEN
jgi:pimeloyl-ACP methyl ester carboxylesterase